MSPPEIDGLTPAIPLRWFKREKTLLLFISSLLAANLVYLITVDQTFSNESSQKTPEIADIWDSLLQDDVPILFVMGEYHTFGDSNATGNIQRLVREFNSISNTRLDDLPLSDVLTTENYLDLDLSYMPVGSAYVLASIVPMLQRENKRVNVTMMADLSSADLESNHIVYIGYISALDKLGNMMFAASGLQIGRSHDELLNLNTEEVYTSTSFTVVDDQPFHDYGLFSTFTNTNNLRIVIAAGMRDAGLMQAAQVLSNENELAYIVQSLGDRYRNSPSNFEALYEVFGMDSMNFNATLIYSDGLEPDRIWRKGITGLSKEGIGDFRQDDLQ